MHISLDGFVCGPNGEMNWIKINDEIFNHVEKRISGTDTAMYGRVTFGMMEAYWPTAALQANPSSHDINHSRWYAQAQKLVLSSTILQDGRPDLTVINHDFADHIRALKNDGEGEILVFGSPSTTHALIREGLIDGYWLFVNPIVLGHGTPLFKDVASSIPLDLVSSKIFECGVTELNYLVKPNEL